MMVIAGSIAHYTANIAAKVNGGCCDFGDYHTPAISADVAGMDVIDGEWIRERLSEERGAQAAFGRHMGWDSAKLSKVLSNKRRVQAVEIPKVLSFFGVASGESPDSFDVVEPGEDAPPGTALVPVYDVAASAGPGTFVEGYEPIAASLALPPDYLRRITKAKIENLSIISVKGDSMEPTLKDDDIVMLDRTKTSTAYDGLFVLRFRDALHVKRLSRGSSPDTVLIISDNKKYKDQEYPADQVAVIGKVIWVGGKV